MTSTARIPLECKDWQPLGPDAQCLLHDGVSFRLERGRTLGVLGPREGHRRACLRALAGLQPSRAERLNVCGVDLRTPSMEELRTVHTRSGFVSDAFPLLINLNAEANVMLPLSYHQPLSTRQARDAAHAVLEKIGYNGAQNMLPAFLSASQCLDVQLARCLIMQPELLFIDEPFTLASADHWAEQARRYGRLPEQFDCGIIVLTANISFIREHCDEVLFVDEQRAQVLAVDELFVSQDAGVQHYLEQLQTWTHSA